VGDFFLNRLFICELIDVQIQMTSVLIVFK